MNSRPLTVYDHTEEFKTECSGYLEGIRRFCAKKNIPYHFTAAVKNNEAETIYITEKFVTPDTVLKQDRLKHIIKTYMDAKTELPYRVSLALDTLSRFDVAAEDDQAEAAEKNELSARASLSEMTKSLKKCLEEVEWHVPSDVIAAIKTVYDYAERKEECVQCYLFNDRMPQYSDIDAGAGTALCEYYTEGMK